MKAVFLRVIGAADKALELEVAASVDSGVRQEARFEVDPASFELMPRSPFVYWVGDDVRRIYTDLPPFETAGRTATTGASTKNDFRYVRHWAEVDASRVSRLRIDTRDRPWVMLTKGGSYSPYYCDAHLLLNWGRDGSALKADLSEYRESRGWGPQWSAELHGHSRYFLSGLTWPMRPHRRGGFAHVHPGGVFGAGGPMLFCDLHEHWALLALLNSRPFIGLLHLLMPRGTSEESGQTLKYEVGYVTAVPLPGLPADACSALSSAARRAWSITRKIHTSDEASCSFLLPALLQVEGRTLAHRASAWNAMVRDNEAELAAIQSDIDDRCFELYDIHGRDREQIERGMDVSAGVTEASSDEQEAQQTEPEGAVDVRGLVAELVSWAVGVAFGRFDVRLAIGEREAPPEPDPFNHLPVCPPGMLTGPDGLPLEGPPAGGSVDWPSDGILVDDEGHSADMLARLRHVFDVVFHEAADERREEASRLLGCDLRHWLARGFFDFHLRTYSKSHRKAPIYWQLATPTASYSVWLCAQRASADSLYRLLNDYVTPRLRHEERKLAALTQQAGPSPTASQRKEIEAQQALVEELRGFRVDVALVAPLWRPDLDDGISVTCAPLWRLVPQRRLWQRELKNGWAKLAKGDHDWAHLAMHLWPQRVVPKCAKDRSLAITHDLDEVFWEEGADGRWRPRDVSQTMMEQLIAERSSAAVAAAVAELERAE
jgi:hypothetical protein